MRYYGFSMQEIVRALPGGNLDLALDPKTIWALANRQHFPVDVNTAGKRELLRVPGLGVRVVNRILGTRRHRRLRFADLKAMGASLRRAKFFLVAADYRPGDDTQESERLRSRLTQGAVQQELF